MSLAILILVVLTAGTVVLVRPGPVDDWLSGDPAKPSVAARAPEPAPSPVLVAAGTGGTAPTAAGIEAAIGPLVDAPALGSRVNVSIVDAATGEALYEKNAETKTTPASTTKLLTAATVLATRGPAYRLSTRAVAGAEPGEVVLIGGGDPSLAVDGDDLFPGAARLDKLAEKVKKALGARKPTRVVIDTSLFTGPETGPGWEDGLIEDGQVARIQALMTNGGRVEPVHNEFGGDERFADPALAAGRAFAAQLGLPETAVREGEAPAAAASSAPAAGGPGTELGVVQSPPLVHVLDWMLEQSDNVLAEALARQVALATGKEASFAGASAAMRAELAELGLPADQAELSDASGLSLDNRISPGLLTDLLSLAASGKHPALGGMFGGLPVAGWSGTLKSRFTDPTSNRVGQGLVRAKTGSLTGVNAISGNLITKDGRLLVFAVLADATGETGAARQALDRIAAKLVTCGCQ
ncbi:D-alanyl-D-alanine carboxypeptidase/D-alanyl-D-alanine endopeptidase [Couchioplanes caeruleus]|uniref:D-alanyl-D-alanine carboxypeptidase/D-alanyl-D-alanine endopeptidase n=1 Tax=Couchioplanes caeruleus TaxID=56438 RepID=UPI002467DA64|nr:D-alanyl-D-alanine carboxypeptidase/D-alanyl-D-alanine-endopeptidase [Couchioplanes caeruleus]